MKYTRRQLLSNILIAGLSTACKKFITIDSPLDRISDSNVYASDVTAIATLTGIYSNFSLGTISGNSGVSIIGALTADEFALFSGVTDSNLIAHYENNLLSTASQTLGVQFWKSFYTYLFRCNAAIEGLEHSTTLTPAVQKQLLGEAHFLRAFIYFHLVNYYGDVCLALSTDPKENGYLRRSSISDVYAQIINDLKDAKELLSIKYLDGTLLKSTVDKVRPTILAASALLARVYLYNKDYELAREEATLVILASASLPKLEDTFLKNSSEAIWQLLPTIAGHNTEDGWTFIIPAAGPSNVSGSNGNPVFLSQQLLNAFEWGDQRKAKWIKSIVPTGSSTMYYFPFKYRSATANAMISEFQMVLRVGEQYLIRAEANAQLGLLNEAKADTNVIRNRANLPNLQASTQQEILNSILQERRVELFTEMSHRWFDLIRFEKVDQVMEVVTPQKSNGMLWRSHQRFFPLPFSDLERNPNLTQNQGY